MSRVTRSLRQGRETTHSDSCSQASFRQSEQRRSSQEDAAGPLGHCREEVRRLRQGRGPSSRKLLTGREAREGRREDKGGGEETQTVISGKMLAWLKPGEENSDHEIPLLTCSSEPDTHCGRVVGGSPAPAGGRAVVFPSSPRFAAWAELHVHYPGSRNEPTPNSR